MKKKRKSSKQIAIEQEVIESFIKHADKLEIKHKVVISYNIDGISFK